MIVKEGGSSFPPIPEAIHHAVCYGLLDLGSHHNKVYDKTAHECILLWELPTERIELKKEGVDVNYPRTISRKYTLSLGERSNLRKDLTSWRGKAFSKEELEGFELKNILGGNCMIQIIHTSKENKVYSNIAAVLPVYKGVQSIKPENDIIYFSMEESLIIPESTPKWIKEYIMESDEMAGRNASEFIPPDEQFNGDDCPF